MTNSNQPESSSAAVSISDTQAVQQILSTTVFNLWDIVNNLTRIKPTRHERYRVTIFGSARAQPGSFVYEEVKRVASALAKMDCDIFTGGGPGLMQAANEGATAGGDAARNKSIGIRVQLPFEQEANSFVQQAFEHQTFFTRLHHFVLTSDAYVVVPGGIGTVLELTMIWQLLQVKHLQNTPLILVGKMWSEFVAWGKFNLLSPQLHLANAEDLDIPICVNTGDEAISLLKDYQSKWLPGNK